MFELLRETWAYARSAKKWWLMPLVLIFVLLAGLVIALEGGAVFLYPLF